MATIFEGEEQRTECLDAFSSYVRSKHLNMKAGDKISALENSDGWMVDAGNGHYHIGAWHRDEDMEGIISLNCTFDDKEFNWKVDRRPRTLFLEQVEYGKIVLELEEIEKGNKSGASWMEEDFTYSIVRVGDTIFAAFAYMNNMVNLDTYHWKVGEGVD